MTAPEDVAATFCATLADEWVRNGVTDAVVAPGSRSTPMALALAAEPRIRLHVFHDERAAGFFALGIGVRSGRPAPVLTTSGTAAVELHPAIVEAHHAGVPMVAVTANRPPEAHGVGAPQTIDQSDLYGPVLRWRAAPGVPDAALSHLWRSWAARAVAEATVASGGRPGPVHLDLAFREPLVGRPGALPPGRAGGEGWRRGLASPEGAPSRWPELVHQARAWSGRTGVIVAGGGGGAPTPVHQLARRLGWPVLADACSAGRVPAPTTVAAFDALLRHPGLADRVRPEFVLRLGAPPASRVLAAWLAGSGAEQTAVAPAGALFDPDHTASAVVAGPPDEVCDALAASPDLRPAPSEWTELWSGAEAAAQAAFDEVLQAHSEVTEPGVARALVAGVPGGTGLVVASSMPIRDVEWYARPRTGVRVLANRGANGIDGTVATVLGAAAGGGGAPTVGLLGDLAFLHDSAALVAAAGRGLDAVLVVIDNRGGGIFSFLPQARSVPAPVFERLFGTPHGVDLVALARVHGLAAIPVEVMAGLVPAVEAARAAGGVSVVVVRTDRTANVAVHEELNAAAGAAAAAVLGR